MENNFYQNCASLYNFFDLKEIFDKSNLEIFKIKKKFKLLICSVLQMKFSF